MALEISYYSEHPGSDSTFGRPVSSEARTVTGTSAQSGVTPDSAVHVRLLNTEAGMIRYAYAESPTATASAGAHGHPLEASGVITIHARPGWKIAAITAS